MDKISNTYYIGQISCATNNAMMKEIADFLKDYEYTLLRMNPTDFFNTLKYTINKICDNYKRCKSVDLQMSDCIFHRINISACKPGSDTSIINITLFDVLREIG